jgi:TolB-like protein/cytoskeletal protein CcmA (bactofilin family)
LPLGYEYIGEQLVKNITKPVSAYKVIMDPRIFSPGDMEKKIVIPPWSKKFVLAAAICIIILLMAFGTWTFYLGGRLTQPASDGKTSIVVLPFANLSNEPEFEYFSDGITEELINALAKVSGLRVVSQTSAFFFKGKDVNLRTVGEKLNVDNVLEGSVRKSGNKLRITAQLIHVADDTHLWSETYDHDMKAGFGIQDEVSNAVVKNIKMKLLPMADKPLPHDYDRRLGVETIVKKGEKIEDGLSAFGANIEIAGTVHGGLEAFGANIIVSGKNQGDLTYGGANVILSGKFLDVVKGVSANLTISGEFEENLEVRAARITIMPTAIIKGDLAYSAAIFDRQAGSQIGGEIVQLDTDEGKAWIGNRGQQIKGPGYLGKSIFWIISTTAILFVGLFINYVLPKPTEEIVHTISDSVWKSMAIGLAILILGPLGIIIAIGTAIGIPFGIILAFSYITMLYISRIYVGLWIGRKLLGAFKESVTTHFFWPFLVGTITIGMLLLIPVIGWVLRFLVILIGLGAMWQVVWSSTMVAKKN